ncbi:MAG TPA: FHA domain-containing protein [Solirubrobacterales bacterium]|nr:FHA domain-containing protein [Solirubrobacterales bacterium]
MAYDPLSTALKFGFLAVLFVFLLVIARSAFRDLRRTASPAPDATGFHAPAGYGGEVQRGVDAWLVAERGGGLERDSRFDLIGGLSIGRSKDSDVQIEDRYASGIHIRLFSREGRYFVEDMRSTNGTTLNGSELEGEAELVDGDTIQIGDTVFRFEAS